MGHCQRHHSGSGCACLPRYGENLFGNASQGVCYLACSTMVVPTSIRTRGQLGGIRLCRGDQVRDGGGSAETGLNNQGFESSPNKEQKKRLRNVRLLPILVYVFFRMGCRSYAPPSMGATVAGWAATADVGSSTSWRA